MLRRIKANILKQLPKKKRLTRTVQVEDKTVAAELRADLEEFRERASELAELSADARRLKRKRPRAASFVEEEKTQENAVIDIEAQQRKEMAQQKKALLMSLFRRTGPAKLPAAELRIKELLSDEAGEKILVFGHHRTVLGLSLQRHIADGASYCDKWVHGTSGSASVGYQVPDRPSGTGGCVRHHGGRCGTHINSGVTGHLHGTLLDAGSVPPSGGPKP